MKQGMNNSERETNTKREGEGKTTTKPRHKEHYKSEEIETSYWRGIKKGIMNNNESESNMKKVKESLEIT